MFNMSRMPQVLVERAKMNTLKVSVYDTIYLKHGNGFLCETDSPEHVFHCFACGGGKRISHYTALNLINK
jgi:hypothetical protein